MEWLATISPETLNVSGYSQAEELYEEIQVIQMHTTVEEFEKNKHKLAELIQKYIPYHVLVAVSAGDLFMLNTWSKYINQNDSTRRTLARAYTTRTINLKAPTNFETDFFNALSFTSLEKTNLKTLYENYNQCIAALQTAELIGKFTPRSQARSILDVENLQRIEELEKDIETLLMLARKETQMNERVRLNVEIQEKRKEIETIKTLITA